MRPSCMKKKSPGRPAAWLAGWSSHSRLDREESKQERWERQEKEMAELRAARDRELLNNPRFRRDMGLDK